VVRFFEDVRVIALIRLGEAVIPALLDLIEKDTRLTRVPEPGGPNRLHRPTGSMIRVTEPAATALMSILKMSLFPPAPWEDEDADWKARRAAHFRHYWKTHGAIPFAERMMRHLKDESAGEENWRHAAENLARWDVDRRFGPRDERNFEAEGRKQRPNPDAAKFKDPTMAEAILAALDRDWAIQLGHGPTRASLFWMLDGHYLEYLVDVGDRRIGPELGRRAAASPDQDMRRRYAFAALRLGSPAEWGRFARDVERGVLPLENVATRNPAKPAADVRRYELWQVGEALIGAQTSESERALAALGVPTHPYFPLVRTELRERRNAIWTTHPVCLAVLRHELHDDLPTGGSYRLEKGDSIRGPSDNQLHAMPSSKEWADLRRFHTLVKERACDAAGLRLSELVLGMPFFHPLCTDADDRINHIAQFLDRYPGRIRVATDSERSALSVEDDRAFIPDIKPLGRPATAADVTAGRAVFHLDGKGRDWKGPVPPKVMLKADAKKENPPAGLVVQAEADANGKAVYGVIFRHAIRKVRADEVE
jgi:hypothetical protein